EWLASSDPNPGGQARAGDDGGIGAELARRFVHCYGPSTPAHFAEWSGIQPAQARRYWRMIEHELTAVDIDGRCTWLLERDLPQLANPPAAAGVRLLPPGDPFTLQRDRETIVADKALQRRIWRPSGRPGIV